MTTYIILGVIAIILVFMAVVYNKLIQHRNFVREGWSGIDVTLKKRYDLIPNLVNVVQQYASHEKELFAEVTRIRTAGMDAHTVVEQGEAESALTRSLRKLLLIAENYPDLKANTNFLELQRQLEGVEDDISLARRYYNGTVRNNNNAVESFPNNLVAGMFGFKRADFFEIEERERSTPNTSIND